MSTPTPIADAYERMFRLYGHQRDATDIIRLETEHAEMLALITKIVLPGESHQHVDAMTCWMCEGLRLLASVDDKTRSVTP